MKQQSSARKAPRNTERIASPEASAGLNGMAIAPPAYGIDFVDREPVDALPDQVKARQPPELGAWLAWGGSIQRQSAAPGAGGGASGVHQANSTGLPDNLKAGIESLSGLSMDDVHVHYNSSRPAQLQALAYTQSTDIHVGPGQENHLPHEAWHVVQQKQGRVKKPTLQANGVSINDDTALEHEADVMGTKALQMRRSEKGAFEFPIHTVGAVGDRYEQEADTVATHIASRRGDFVNCPHITSASTGQVQRLITPDELTEKDPVNVKSKKYPIFLQDLGSYNDKMEQTKLPAANYLKSLHAAQMIENQIYTWVIPVLVPRAEEKKSSHPMLAGFVHDVEVEKDAAKRVTNYYRTYLKVDKKNGAPGHEEVTDLDVRLPAMGNEKNAKQAIDEQRTSPSASLYTDPEKGAKNEKWWKLALESAMHAGRAVATIISITTKAIASFGGTLITSIPSMIGAIAHFAIAFMKGCRAHWQRTGVAAGKKADKMASYVKWEGIVGAVASLFSGGIGTWIEIAKNGIVNGIKLILKGVSAACNTIANTIKTARGAAGKTWGKWKVGMSKMVETICGLISALVGKISALLSGGVTGLVELVATFISDTFNIVQKTTKASRGVDDLNAGIKELRAQEAGPEEEE